ncbi:MAG: transcriptional regulator [Clostridia bacterium]|nr:transcriptional regulator [Clostridia bacterium]
MNREQFISLCNRKEKLVRNELGYSQEKMSVLLGLSKKTLVEIEKWRASLGWQGAVTLCTLFQNTREITLAFGNDIPALLRAMTEEAAYLSPFESPYSKWVTVLNKDGRTIEQNTASQLYRLREKGETVASSFELAELRKRVDL